MPSQSIAGINVKIGADTKDLRDELGKVTNTITTDLEPAKQTTKDLADNFKSVGDNTTAASQNIQQIAQAMQTIGKELLGFAKSSVEDALKVNPETAAAYKNVSDAFDSVKVAFGEGLLSTIEDWGPKVTDLLNGITTFAKENPDTAGLFVSMAGGIGLLMTTATVAAPILQLFNVSLAGLSMSALGVAGAIVGLVVILGYLSSTLDEIGDKASNTAEEIANMNTETQKIVELGTGELSVQDRDDYDWVANVWDPVKKEFVEGWAYLDELTGEYVLVSEEIATAVAETTEAISEQTEAMDAVAESTDGTKTAAEQAQEVYEQMQQAASGMTETMSSEDLTDALQLTSDLLESEAFKQFAQEPVDPTVGESWETFGAAVQAASTGFSDLNAGIGDGSLSGIITGLGGDALGAAAGFVALADSINMVIAAYEGLNKHRPTGGGSGVGHSTDVFRANGGPVNANQPYIVGELRPEIFIPDEDGMIVPTTGNTTNINIGDVYGESYLKNYVISAVTGAIRQEVRLGA